MPSWHGQGKLSLLPSPSLPLEIQDALLSVLILVTANIFSQMVQCFQNNIHPPQAFKYLHVTSSRYLQAIPLKYVIPTTIKQSQLPVLNSYIDTQTHTETPLPPPPFYNALLVAFLPFSIILCTQRSLGS
jgi:hypothetical protein